MILSLCLWITLTFQLPHPIHVSISEVEIREHTIAWTARIYKDDLLLGLYGKKALMDVLDHPEKIKKDILRYLAKRIVVTIEGTTLHWVLTDIHVDPEAIWITLTTEFTGHKPGSISLLNTILMEVYRDQKNIVNLTFDSKSKKLLFEAGDGQKVVSF